MHRLMIPAVAIVLTCGAPAVQGEDWTRWLGPRGNMTTTEKLPDKLPAEMKPLWSKSAGIGYSTPAALDGKIYLFSMVDRKDTLTCYNAADGQEIWSQSYDSGFTGQYPGTRAAPLIVGDRIYTYGGNSDLTARQFSDGKEIWRINIMEATGAKNLRWGVASAPLLHDGKLYVQNGVDGPFLVGVDAQTGKIVVKSENGQGGYTHPIVVDVEGKKQVIAFAGKALYGVDPDSGKTLWSLPWVTSYDVNASTPVYRDGHLFVSSNYNRGCMMVKLDASGAKKLWENKNLMAHFQPAILDGDSLYGNSQGMLVCLEWPTGQVRWQIDKRAAQLGNGGSLLRSGDKLLALSESGMLYLVKATPEAGQVLGSAKLFATGRDIWTSPILYNGKVFAKGVKEFGCYAVE